MKYGSRSHTNGQQAPTSWPGVVARQATRSSPLQTASKIRKRSVSGTIHISNRATRNVITMLNGVDSGLARSQPIAPVVASGAGSESICCIRTKRICATARSPSLIVIARPSPFHQRDPRVVNVHERRGDKAYGEIDRHRDCDDFARLTGLI